MMVPVANTDEGGEMKTSERIRWNENFPKYVTAMVEKNRVAQNRIAAQIAREAGATRAEVYMVALNQKRRVAR